MKKCRTVRFMWVCTLLLVVLMCSGCGEADRTFIGNEYVQLEKSVSFSDKAFTIDEAEAWLYIAGAEPAKTEKNKDIFIPENAERLSYCLNGQGKEMRLPAQTVALQLDEKSWEIYGYTGSGTVKIGEIYAADD